MKKSFTEKIFSVCEKENKLDCYRGKDCIEKVCKKIKEHAMKIINYMIPLTYEENRSYEEQEVCHICKKSFVRMNMMKNVKGLLIVSDLCQLHYQTFLITCPEFLSAKKEKNA